LYYEAKEKQVVKNLYKPNHNILDKSYTFSPQISNGYLKASKNPLYHDLLLNKMKTRYQEARKNKIIDNLIIQNGNHSLNKLRNNSSIISNKLDNSNLKSFSCHKELKSNKDTFENYFQAKFRQVKPKIITSNKPILTIDIRINHNTSEELKFYEHSNFNQIIDTFCQKHMLSDEKQQLIYNLFKEKFFTNK